jgi:hypothetical protein
MLPIILPVVSEFFIDVVSGLSDSRSELQSKIILGLKSR